MNTKDFIRLGVPLGESTRRATDFISKFILAGGDKARLEQEVTAVLAIASAFTEDPLRQEFAKALLKAPPPPRAEPVKYRQWGEGLEHEAVMQMEKACLLPVSVAGALMPDAHVGYGLPIGGVLATENAVIPYAVGVDIACLASMWNIRQVLPAAVVAALLAAIGFGCSHGPVPTASATKPAPFRAPARQSVINTTDLYFPSQDGGDNFDLVTPYGLDEVEQRLVVLDGNHHLRDPEAQKSARLCRDPRGIARDPGYIAVAQLDHIFARRTPWCIGPWTRMKSEDDRLDWIPQAEQTGIQTFIETLRAAPRPVHVTVFGSARTIAAALNREPALLKAKIAMVHFCAGTAGNGARFLEWNIGLDQLAARRLLGSDLPITLYPCATAEGPFALGRHNGYWQLPNLEFVRDLDRRLRSYLVYQLGPSNRLDTLRVVEEDPDPALLSAVAGRPHNVWETCVWLAISGRKLVRRADGTHRILKPAEIGPGDRVLAGGVIPCRLRLNDGHGTCRMWFDEPYDIADLGLFDWEAVDTASNRWMYDRGDALENQAALREALPALYRSFSPPR